MASTRLAQASLGCRARTKSAGRFTPTRGAKISGCSPRVSSDPPAARSLQLRHARTLGSRPQESAAGRREHSERGTGHSVGSAWHQTTSRRRQHRGVGGHGPLAANGVAFAASQLQPVSGTSEYAWRMQARERAPGGISAAGSSTKPRLDTLGMGASTRIKMYIQVGRVMLRTLFSVLEASDTVPPTYRDRPTERPGFLQGGHPSHAQCNETATHPPTWARPCAARSLRTQPPTRL